MIKKKCFFVMCFFVCALFAADVFVLPKVDSKLKAEGKEFFDNECKGCHRWARKFAAPPMKDNVEFYSKNPEKMIEYLMNPTPKHPEQWPLMEITPLTQEQAKMMTAYLLFILNNPDDPSKPK